MEIAQKKREIAHVMRLLIPHPYSVTVATLLLLFFTTYSMKNKFLIGAIAGMSSLALAVPLVAQLANAQAVTSSSTQAQTSQIATQDTPDQQVNAHKGGHMANGITEQLLTGDNASKATAAALAAVPGGTVDRVETDAEGDAYEAHMTKSDGSHVTVKFDANFGVTNTEDGPMGR